MTFDNLYRYWLYPGPWQVHPLTGRGSNNLVYIVDTPESGRYILRTHSNHTDSNHISYELAVMTALQTADLPFQVPAPIPTLSGERWLVYQNENGKSCLLTLWPFIEGEVPTADNLAKAYSCGEALAILHRALAGLDGLDVPHAILPPAYGALDRMNSLITDPTLVPQLLPLEPTIRDRLDQLYQEVLPKISGFYSELPCQIIHGDYIRSNLLMQGQQVKGVLDFEFTTPDIRAMDLAAALSWWNPRRLLGTGQEWPPMEKFYRGYISRGNFSDAEIEAIPTLLKLREIAVLTHFTGRYKQGLESINQITDRANLALQMVGWIESVEEKLLNSLQAWR